MGRSAPQRKHQATTKTRVGKLLQSFQRLSEQGTRSGLTYTTRSPQFIGTSYVKLIPKCLEDFFLVRQSVAPQARDHASLLLVLHAFCPGLKKVENI